MTSLRNVLSCQKAAKNPPAKCLRARQAFAKSGCFSTPETHGARAPWSSGNPAPAHAEAEGRSHCHRPGRASPSLLGKGCQPLLTPEPMAPAFSSVFLVFFFSLGFSLDFSKKEPVNFSLPLLWSLEPRSAGVGGGSRLLPLLR